MNETPTRVSAEIDLDAAAGQRADAACPRAAGRADGRGEVGRVRARGRAVRPGGRARRGRPGWGPPRPRRRSRCAPPGCRGRHHVLAVDARRALARGRRGRPGRVGQRDVGPATRSPTPPARAGRTARVQLKADTGLGRNGCQPDDWAELVGEALRRGRGRLVRVTGLWSHFACADEPGHPSIAAQLTRVPRHARVRREGRACEPEVRHIANSPATLTLPEAHFDLVRTGHRHLRRLAQRPRSAPRPSFGLRPVMTPRRLARAGQARPRRATASATGITTSRRARRPSASSPSATRTASRGTPPAPGPVLVGGKWRTVAGRVAMDQFVVDLGGDEPAAGRRGRAVRARRPRRAHRRGLGAGGGHHRVRDRHPHRNARSARLCERG